MSKVFYLAHEQARRAVGAFAMTAPDGWRVKFDEPRRTDAENRLLHALIGEIAEAKEWAGRKRSAEVWKRLLVAAWCRVIGEAVEVLPALDGHGVDIVPARTSSLSKKECADLIEFIYAWGAENGMLWPANSTEQDHA